MIAKIALFLPIFVKCTVDMNLPEFEHIADHLTPEECHKLVAALHYHTFDIPQQIAAAERKLPDDIPCLDLLLHWNSAAGEGKGRTHVEVSHRLNQISREDLAKWLSKTVFHELSKNLEEIFTTKDETVEEETRRPVRTTPQKEEIIDEAPWLAIDSILSILVIIALSTLAVLLIALGIIFCKKEVQKQLDYEQLESTSSDNEKKRKYEMNYDYSSEEETDTSTTLKSEY